MSNKQKTAFWFVAFCFSLIFSLYTFSGNSGGLNINNNTTTTTTTDNQLHKLQNESNVFYKNICKQYPDINVEWCQLNLKKDKEPLIIIKNDTITTLSKKFDIVSKVVKVVDGDTIDLQSGERVRLAIANTPERGHEGYALATQFTKNLCLGKDAKVDLDEGQKGGSFDRVIGLVYCDGHNLNEELIEGGYAQVWVKFCAKSEFREMLCK